MYDFVVSLCPAGALLLVFRDIVQPLAAGQVLGQRFAAPFFAGMRRDDDVVIALDGRCGCVGGEQRKLVGIDGRCDLAFTAEQLVLQQANHLLQVVDLLLLRRDDLLE